MTKFLANLRKVPVSTLIVLAVAIFAGFGFYWWRAVYSDPQNVFQAMLNNSLRLNGVTRTVTQDDNGQGVHQVTQYSATADATVQSSTTLKQGAETTVETESIGSASEDFVRYTRIDTTQTNQEGKALDFSSVLNVWGQSDEAFSGGVTDGELYNETVLGVVPFGRLTADQRRELMDLIEKEKVYEVDFTTVKRSTSGSRPTYTYDVGVDAEGYVKLIQRFGEMTGLTNLQQLDPSAYAGSERLQFEMTVDVWSRQLVRLQNAGSPRIEEFSGHNASREVDLPGESISVEELQTRLQNIQ